MREGNLFLIDSNKRMVIDSNKRMSKDYISSYSQRCNTLADGGIKQYMH